MILVYIKPNTLYVFYGEYKARKFTSHYNFFFRSPQGYIDMYPIDVGSLIYIEYPRLIYPHKPYGRH